MLSNQVVTNPFGITVFGSSVVKVDPDIVSVDFAVSHTEQHPKDSFKVVRETSKAVNAYLHKVSFEKEVSSSRMSLERSWRYEGAKEKFLGYTATINFRVLIHDVNELENFLIGIVDGGVNHINFMQFQTSKLKEYRAVARRQAVEAAREKAENYCAAANVKLGKVIHIEDVNPDTLSSRYSGHEAGRASLDDAIQAFSPGNITINAAVLVSYNFMDE